MQARSTLFTVIKWVIVGLLVGLMLFILLNPVAVRYSILDWYRRANYDPPAQITAINERIGLTDQGTSLFYATQPQLVTKENFSRFCPSSENANVLGCYSQDTTYILDVDEASLEAVEDVTAAHELLHASWARMSNSEQTALAKELERVYENLDDKRLIELIESYEENRPAGDQLYIPNELHSILATEAKNVGDTLETHYAQYFKDRQAVVELFHSYNAEFEQRQDRVAAIQRDLERLRTNIDDKNALIDQLTTQNEELIRRINELRNEGRTSESNQLVPQQNSLVARIRREVAAVNQLISSFNAKVEENNNLALELNELTESLDSRSSQTE